MVVAEDAYLCYPILTFQCIVEAGIFVTFLLDWREAFKEEYEKLCKQRTAYQIIRKREQNLTTLGERISGSFRDPKNELRKALPGESQDLMQLADDVLAEQNKPYFEIQKDRIARSGPTRINTTFKLREEFYSAMWLYMFKADYILCIDEADMVENSNKPDIALMSKVAEDKQTNDNLVSNENATTKRELIPSTDEKEKNDQKLIPKNTIKIEEEKKEYDEEQP